MQETQEAKQEPAERPRAGVSSSPCLLVAAAEPHTSGSPPLTGTAQHPLSSAGPEQAMKPQLEIGLAAGPGAQQAPCACSSRWRTKGTRWPFCAGPTPSLYLEQLEYPMVRLWTVSSSWSIKCSCFWAQARPWAGEATCTSWPGVPGAPAPHSTLLGPVERRGLGRQLPGPLGLRATVFEHSLSKPSPGLQ